jgi:hypothetical protein
VETIRVLIADNQGPCRPGLAVIPKDEPNSPVIGETSKSLLVIAKAPAPLSRIKKSLPTTTIVTKLFIDCLRGI